MKRAGLKLTIMEGEAMILEATAIIDVPITVETPHSDVDSATFYSSVLGGLLIKSSELKSSPPAFGFDQIPNPDPIIESLPPPADPSPETLSYPTKSIHFGRIVKSLSVS